METRETVFSGWLKAHQGLLAKVTRAYAYSPEGREDLRQEILLQLWRSIPSYRGESKESTWIYRVALNTAMTWRRSGRSVDTTGEPVCDTAPHPGRQPDGNAADRELVEWAYAEMAEWSKVDRSVLLLCLDGLSYREMAEVLGISQSNIGVKLHRLKARLIARGNGVFHGP